MPVLEPDLPESHLTEVVEEAGAKFVTCICGYKSPSIDDKYIEVVRNRHETITRIA